PRRIPDVAPDAFQPGFPPDVADLILDGGEAADLDAGRAARLGPSHPGANLCLDRDIEVGAKLVVELLFDATTPKQGLQSGEQAADRRHQKSPSDALRILPIAAVCASQSRISRLSRARPDAVSA